MSSAQTSARFLVNGHTYDVHIPPNCLLLDVLREELGWTGTTRGCDDGSCGGCTIIVDGEPMLACMMLALAYQNCAITTIRGGW
jgi:aerobic-type carbon monoxide dehydrogenase small subunit (CoxS/CutS family)